MIPFLSLVFNSHKRTQVHLCISINPLPASPSLLFSLFRVTLGSASLPPLFSPAQRLSLSLSMSPSLYSSVTYPCECIKARMGWENDYNVCVCVCVRACRCVCMQGRRKGGVKYEIRGRKKRMEVVVLHPSTGGLKDKLG